MSDLGILRISILETKELSNIDQPNGIAGLDANGVINSDKLPDIINAHFIPVHGTETEIDNYLGSSGEITSDGKRLRLMDGVNAGGIKIAMVGDGSESSNNSVFTVITNSDNSLNVSYGDIADNAYINSDITAVQLGTSVTSIGNGAFDACYGFTGNLTIPDSVTSIGYNAFNYCSGFTGNLTISNSVTSIGSYAFSSCSGFTGNLTIPNSVTTIGSFAFGYCSGLTNVNCYVTRTIMNASNCLMATGVTTLHARSSDGTWTAGADTIGGKALTVIKDLV